MKNFPIKIKVGGCDLRIKFLRKLSDPINNEHIDGRCKINTGELLVATHSAVDEEVALSRIVETILHEIFHAIDIIYNGDKLKESIIESLTTGWFSVLSANNIDLSSTPFILPPAVSIYGIKYDIIREGEENQSYLNFYKTKIHISPQIQTQYLLKFLLTTPITDAMLKTSNIQVKQSVVSNISHGIVQVFSDYPMYNIVKRTAVGKINNSPKRDNKKNKREQSTME